MFNDPIDLLVIGAGFTGTAAAIAARERGLSTIVLHSSTRPCASAVSAGLYRSEWYRPPLRPQVGWIGLRATRERVWRGYGAGSPRELPERAVGVVDDVEHLLARAQRVNGHVTGLEANRSEVVCTVGGMFQVRARALVLAAGAWSSDLADMLGASLPVTGLFGRALIVRRPHGDTDDVLTWQSGPYSHVTSRPVNAKQRRIGDTVEKRPGDHHLHRLKTAALNLHPDGLDIVEIPAGWRPVLPNGPDAGRLAPRVAYATGGARIGLGLAMPLALEALDALEPWL